METALKYIGKSGEIFRLLQQDTAIKASFFILEEQGLIMLESKWQVSPGGETITGSDNLSIELFERNFHFLVPLDLEEYQNMKKSYLHRRDMESKPSESSKREQEALELIKAGIAVGREGNELVGELIAILKAEKNEKEYHARMRKQTFEAMADTERQAEEEQPSLQPSYAVVDRNDLGKSLRNLIDCHKGLNGSFWKNSFYARALREKADILMQKPDEK